MGVIPRIQPVSEKGLRWARDKEGKKVEAGPGIGGVLYCPYCGTRLHCTHKKGSYFFIRFEGQPFHAEGKPCFDLVNNGTVTVTEKSPEEFFKELLQLTMARNAVITSGDRDEYRMTKDEEDTEWITTVKNDPLDIIATVDPYSLRPDEPFYEGGTYPISDYLMLPQWGYRFLKNPGFVLGNRTVLARYVGYDIEEKVLEFKMFGEGYTVRFQVVFSEAYHPLSLTKGKSLFRTYLEKFLVRYEVKKRQNTRTKYKDALI